MKEKTEQKMQAIRRGKFGVEVEMYGLSRRRATLVLIEFFNRRYGGDVDRDGYDGVIDNAGRTWKFVYDSSIEGCDTSELVTPILGYDDIELLQDVIRELRRNGARSNAEHDCGIHIHIDASQHTPDSLRALTNLVYTHEGLLLKALNVDSRRESWCKPIDPNFLSKLNIMKPKTMDDVMRIWYESQGTGLYARDDHYNSTRYHLLNFHSLWQNKGIEFRCFQFSEGVGMHAGELKAYIQFALALNAMAESAPFAKRKIHQIQTDNPKYAMASFLSRLGMRGEEFETARRVLTRDLEGTSRPRRRRSVPEGCTEGFVEDDDTMHETNVEFDPFAELSRESADAIADLDRSLNEAVRNAELA